MDNIRVGEIFKLYNEGTNPPKYKIHICIDDKCFVVVNTKNNYPFSLPISKNASSFLMYDSYICCSRIFLLYKKGCIIEKKEKLPDIVIKELINYIPCVLTLTPYQIDSIVLSLQNALSVSIAE